MNKGTFHKVQHCSTRETSPEINEDLPAESLFALAVYYQNSAEAEKAVECYQLAIDAEPGLVEAFYNIGVIRYEQKSWELAIRHFKKAWELKPDFIDAAFNLAAAYKETGQFHQAAMTYQTVVERDPNRAEAFDYLGICRLKLRQISQAIKAFQGATGLDPHNPFYWYHLAEANLLNTSMDEVLFCYQKAISLKPDWDSAHYNLAVAMRIEERLDEAKHHLKTALRINPDFSAAHAFLFQLAQHTCDWSLAAESNHKLDQLTQAELSRDLRCAESPMTNIRRTTDVRVNLQVARSWSRQVSQWAMVSAPRPAFKHHAPTGHRIRVGYLSNDFKDHAVAHQIRGMFEKHDRQRFEIFGYALNVSDGTRYRRLMADACDHFIELHGLSDLEAARQIHADGIHILVDMAGHSRNNRLGIAALRPAPILVSFLGFLGTTGAEFIDYVLADAIVVPPEHAACYTEKVVYLPHCYQANDDQQPISRRSYARSDFNLPDEGFVYCCFNQPYKIDAPLFSTWMEILKQVDGSVLWLVKRSPTAQASLCRAAERAGVDPGRLVFTGFMPLEDNLARLRLADLALDTCIYNGGATTSNALWTGVPVLTLLGHNWVSRMSASALTALGIPELITNDIEAYCQKAVYFGNHVEALGRLRQKVWENRKTAPLFNTDLFTRHVEQAYTYMFQREVNHQKPASFKVKP